jgi:hypothetical protein
MALGLPHLNVEQKILLRRGHICFKVDIRTRIHDYLFGIDQCPTVPQHFRTVPNSAFYKYYQNPLEKSNVMHELRKAYATPLASTGWCAMQGQRILTNIVEDATRAGIAPLVRTLPEF